MQGDLIKETWMSSRSTSRTMARALSLIAVGLMTWLSVPAVAEKVPTAVLAQARVHFERGSAFHASGDYARAAAEYRAAYALYPSPELLFNLGQVARLSGDRKAALDYYQRYLSAEPEGRASEEARRHIEQLDPEQAERPRVRTLQLTLTRPPSPASDPRVQTALVAQPEGSHRPPRKRWVWGVIGGVGAAVIGGVVAGAVVGTMERPPRPDVVLR
jgi:tetratricopeptide (TPR) repeat protein